MSTSKELIYLVAPSGHPNYGDEFIARQWLRTLAIRRPHARVVLDCRTPGTAAVLLSGEHPHLTVTDTLFRVCDHARAHAADGDDHFDDVIAHVEAIIADPVRAPLLQAGIQLAASADIVHVVGGGWFNDMWPEHAGIVAAASVAGSADAMHVMTGVGLIPGTETARRLSQVWPRFRIIDVRDAGSAELVDEYLASTAVAEPHPAPSSPRNVVPTALSCTGDDAWLDIYAGGNGTDQARARSVIVCAQADVLDDGLAPILAKWLIRTLRTWGATGRDIAIVEAIPGIDQHIWNLVREIAAESAPELCDDALIIPFFQLWHHGVPARPGQKWISTRFHPHLIAAAHGADGIAVDAHVGNYYSVKHQVALDAGSHWPVVELPQSNDIQPGGGISAADAQACAVKKQGIVDTIYPLSRLTAMSAKIRRYL